MIQRKTDFYKELSVEFDFLEESLVAYKSYTADKLSITSLNGAYNR